MSDEVTTLLAATAAAFTALMFARAAWHKLSDFAEFTGFVADYRLVPEAQVRPASAVLVAIEVAIPVALAIPGTRTIGAVLAIGLLALYGAAMAINIARGRISIECGCGGAPNLLSPALVVRNAVLAAIAALVLLSPGIGLSFGDAVIAVALGLLLLACFVLAEQVLANGMRARLARR